MVNIAEELEKDLNWRESELATLKRQIIDSESESIKRKVLLRSLWVMLYAHYEGFSIYAWELYLNELEKTLKQRNRFNSILIQHSLEKEFSQLRGNLSTKNLYSFFNQDLPTLLSSPIGFPIKLKSNSNLWPSLFIENNTTIGLPSELCKKYNLELKTLVSRRNDIAHGQNMIIKNIDEYKKYEEATLLVMHELAVEIVDSIENNSYEIT